MTENTNIFTDQEIQSLIDNAKTVTLHYRRHNRSIVISPVDGTDTIISSDHEQHQEIAKQVEESAKAKGVMRINKDRKWAGNSCTYYFVGDEPEKLTDSQRSMLESMLRKEQNSVLDKVDFSGQRTNDFHSATIKKMIQFGYIRRYSMSYWVGLSESGKARALKEFPELELEAMKIAKENAEIKRNRLFNLKQAYINKMADLLPDHCAPMIEIKSNNEKFFANPTAYTFTFRFTVGAVIKVDYSPWNKQWDVETVGTKNGYRSVEINSDNLDAYIKALQMAQDVIKALNTIGHIEI